MVYYEGPVHFIPSFFIFIMSKFSKKLDTINKHKNMKCQVFEIKLVKLNKVQKEDLNALFREAKWFKNYIVSLPTIFDADTTLKEVNVVRGDHTDFEKFKVLSGQNKQLLFEEYKTAVKAMSTNKKNGHTERNGKFKFKSECNEVPLKQYKNSYLIDFENNKIKIAKIKNSFKVKGLNQIPENADICNAQLLRKASGFYLHVVCYTPKAEEKSTGNVVGIDFGIKNNLTTTDGEVINVSVPETKAVKLASRRFNKYIHRKKLEGYSMKEIRYFKHYWKLRNALQRAYEKMVNIKTDKANKIVSQFLKLNDLVAIQDEMVKNWHKGLFGKQIQHSCMGLIKVRLKKNPKTYVIGREFPSTQICPICGQKTKHSLDKRDYDCQYCGYHHDDRDVKAAEMILNETMLRTS